MRVSTARVALLGSRTLGLALVFAVTGFFLALASSVDDSVALDARDVRAVGTSLPLRFTTPHVGVAAVFANEFDLGDACLGSVITRYVTAEGGLRPYRFTSTGPNSLANLVSNTTSSLTFSISGLLTGSTPGAIPVSYITALGTPGLHFPVKVTDSFGTTTNSATGNFNLFLFDKNTAFRFGTDTLATARLASNYVSRVAVLNGQAPVTVSVVSVTDIAGKPFTLSEMGLYMAPDGTLIGKPLVTGTFNILVRAKDRVNATAASRRNPAALDQVHQLDISDYAITSSDAFTLSCQVKGNNKQVGKDSLRYKGVVNTLGNDEVSLDGTPFSFAVGGVTFSGRLDKKGAFTVKNADKSSFSFKVSARTGAVDVKIANSTFVATLDLVTIPAGLVRRPIQIVLGEAVISTEVIDFETSSDGSKYALNYQLGKHGRTASGGFQITSVRGKDGTSDQTGQTGDSWKVGFLAQPRLGVTNPSGLKEGLDGATAVSVRVGLNFVQTATGAFGGKVIKVKGGSTDSIKSFSLDTVKAKGSLETRVLATNVTQIPQAQKGLQFGNIFFPLGIDIARQAGNATYTGEHARRIFNLGKNYADMPPRSLTK